MKSMSIIGIVLASICLVSIFGSINYDLEAAAGWGLIGMLYFLPFSIVSLLKVNKEK